MLVALTRLPVPAAARFPSLPAVVPPPHCAMKKETSHDLISPSPLNLLWTPSIRLGSTARNIAPELDGHHCFVRSLRGWLFVLSLSHCVVRTPCHITGVFGAAQAVWARIWVDSCAYSLAITRNLQNSILLVCYALHRRNRERYPRRKKLRHGIRWLRMPTNGTPRTLELYSVVEMK